MPCFRFPLFLAAAVAALLAGCATAPRFPAGEAVLRGDAVAFPPPPDSLRAELELIAFEGGRKSSVSAALSAKPYARYKLDLFGLPGMTAGSMYWTPARWTLVLFEREAYAEGIGESVAFGPPGLRDISIHHVFSWLWGDFFPGLSGAARKSDTGAAGSADPPAVSPPGPLRAEQGVVRYAAGGRNWRVTLDPGTGLVREALREDSAFRIRFEDYKAGGRGRLDKGPAVPRKVGIFGRQGQLLEIRVRNVEYEPNWRRDPFFIKVPKDFRRLEREPDAEPEPVPEPDADEDSADPR